MSFTKTVAGSDMRKQLEIILESAKTKPEWGNNDREILRRLRISLGSPSEIAELLHVAVSTVYGWERQTREEVLLPPPPYQKLEKFFDVIQKRERRVENDDTALLARIRTVKHLFECGEHCHTFWTLRSSKPFVALTDEKVLDGIIAFLDRKPVRKSFLVFPKVQILSSKTTEAKKSFEGLKLKLNREFVNLRPVEVNQKQALTLGLTDDSPSFAMAEYTPEGYAQYGKSFDVWMEFDFDVSVDPQSKRNIVTRWLELPREQAERWKEQRQSFWDGESAKVK